MYASTVASFVATAATAASAVGPEVAPTKAVVRLGSTVVDAEAAAATVMTWTTAAAGWLLLCWLR